MTREKHATRVAYIPRSLRWLNTVLIGCEWLPFIGVLFETRCRYKARIWHGQNVFIRHYVY